MINEGIINANKLRDMTSHDCVQALRRITGIKRIGHTGTLDPQAEGVLPICIGGAARIMEYLDLDFKKYKCEMKLGLTTETQDIWGEVISDRRDRMNGINTEGVIRAFKSFDGLIEQAPPKYSAVRYAGRRLYEYARAGEAVEIKKRRVFIKDILVTEIDLPVHRVKFDVTCSKGTYVRAICNDIGEMLGCGGAMSGLTRLASGVFGIDEAVRLDELSGMDEGGINSLVKPADYPLVHFGSAIIRDKNEARRFINGRPVAAGNAEVVATPEYSSKEPPFEIRLEYKKAYNMYEKGEGENVFLGVAFLDEGRGEFTVDKIFYRGTCR